MNRRAERWREVAWDLRLALGASMRQMRKAGMRPSPDISDAFVRGVVAFSSVALSPSYPLPAGRALHACDYDATGFCRVCDLPQP